MDAGLYIAAQGMLAEQVRQSELANNLSNASTPGYKPDQGEQRSFDALLLQNTATGQTIGTIQAGTAIDKVETDTDPAALQTTGKPLDFGVAGDGFFAVQTAQGVRYTRDGQFSSNANGDLVDQQGDTVLSQNGSPIKVSDQGTVAASSVGVFNVTNPVKQGDNYFTGTAAGKATGVVHAGELEESGVDSIQTMTDMIASMRTYQSGQQAIQSIDQTMQENASQVGSLGG